MHRQSCFDYVVSKIVFCCVSGNEVFSLFFLNKLNVNLTQFSVCRDEDELLNTQCPQHLELRWQTEVSSSIYASPLIADINR